MAGADILRSVCAFRVLYRSRARCAAHEVPGGRFRSGHDTEYLSNLLVNAESSVVTLHDKFLPIRLPLLPRNVRRNNRDHRCERRASNPNQLFEVHPKPQTFDDARLRSNDGETEQDALRSDFYHRSSVSRMM